MLQRIHASVNTPFLLAGIDLRCFRLLSLQFSCSTSRGLKQTTSPSKRFFNTQLTEAAFSSIYRKYSGGLADGKINVGGEGSTSKNMHNTWAEGRAKSPRPPPRLPLSLYPPIPTSCEDRSKKKRQKDKKNVYIVEKARNHHPLFLRQRGTSLRVVPTTINKPALPQKSHVPTRHAL